MIQVYCNIQRLPSCKVYRISHAPSTNPLGIVSVDDIQITCMGSLLEGSQADPQYCPQIYRPQLPSGDHIYSMVFKPHNFQVGVKYPTVLYVYGGPEVQTVSNTFKVSLLGFLNLRLCCFSSKGSKTS